MTSPTKPPLSMLPPLIVDQSSIPAYALVHSPALRTTPDRFWDKPSLTEFNSAGGDNAPYLALALAAGNTYQKAVYIPSGAYTFNTNTTVSTGFGIVGDGMGRTVLNAVDMNSALLTITATGGDIEQAYIKNLEARAVYSNDAVAGSNGCFLEFGNGSANYIQHNRFQDLCLNGFATAVRSIAPTRTTAFGQESYINWNTYDGIMLGTWSRACKVGFDFTAGSGTGNLFTGIGGRGVGGRDPDGVNRAGVVLRYSGATVVGDIIIANSHLAGYTGSILLQGAVNSVYRNRVLVIGNQFDAGMDIALNLDTTGTVWSNLVLQGNNIGGNCKIADNIPTLRSSIIDDQGVGNWRSGNYKDTLAGGSQQIPMFDVYVGDNDGTFVEVVGAGLIQGVSPSVTLWSGTVQRASGTSTVVVRDSNVQNPVSANAIIIGVTATSYGIRITTNYNASGAGSAIDCQVVVKGGKTKVVRL